MKIQIIGVGIVGKSHAYLTQKLKHEVTGYDIKSDYNPYCFDYELCMSDSIENADITFICTPESEIENIVLSLIDMDHKGLIVIRSTLPIGLTNHLMEKFDVHICHNPDFLKEERSPEEIMNPSMIIIGECCQRHGDLLESFYKPINKPIFRVNSNMSELIKLTDNAYLSTLITFWNEINELCNKLNINTEEISKIILHDPRISDYGCKFFGEPYEGKCLPKDINYLIECFHNQGINPKLFEACESINKIINKK